MSPAEKVEPALRISVATARIIAVVVVGLIAVPLVLIFVISLSGSKFYGPPGF